jgi:hypothetical protein
VEALIMVFADPQDFWTSKFDASDGGARQRILS